MKSRQYEAMTPFVRYALDEGCKLYTARLKIPYGDVTYIVSISWRLLLGRNETPVGDITPILDQS